MKALLLAFVAGSALALLGANPPRDLYVSINGTMLDRYGNQIAAPTDLGEVVRQSSTGDTIWIEDGYVWEGVMEDNPTSGTCYCRNALATSQGITIRSVSGKYDEANKLGVTIKGQWAEPGVQPYGEKAVRCFRTTGNATLMGLIFEGGATANSNEFRGGGAAYFNSNGKMINCLMRNCKSCWGGAVRGAGTVLINCVITNCSATVSGGAVWNANLYDCLCMSNTANIGGAFLGNNLTISNCVFVSNVAGQYSATGGGGAIKGDGLSIFDCAFTNNQTGSDGGAVCGQAQNVVHCTFSGNRAIGDTERGSGGALSGNSATLVTDSLFVDNFSSNNYVSCGGGALYGATAVRCVFRNNTIFGNGGAAYKAILTDCLIDGNTTAYALTKDGKQSSSSCMGGGLGGCTATNCTIINNTAVKNHNWTGRGGGAYNCDLVFCTISNNVAKGVGGGCFQPDATRTIERCLFVGNTGGSGNDTTTGPAGGVSGVSGKEPTLVHCTLTDNAGRGVYNVKLEDCISWGNGQDDANIVSAVRSCASVLTDEMGEGNVTENPKLRTKPAGYVYWPANSKCYNMGRFDAYAIGTLILLR